MRCDSHVHIVAPPARYPQIAERHYLAGTAELATLQRAAAARNIERFVVVQPSFYGTDNSATLDALDVLGRRGRGVAVVGADAPDDMLRQMHRRGIRGLRINLYSILGQSAPLAQAVAAMEKIAVNMDWHVEVIAPIALITEQAELVASAHVPVVIDHYGLYGAQRADSARGRALLDLLRHPHVWMKLSAPYRVSSNPLEAKPDREWLAAILNAAPSRCVWGSDWPHTPAHDEQKGADIPAPYRAISYTGLYDEFAAAVGSAEVTKRILSDNPARLYGFD
jgi:predicted TIM-barrel fold metal-dependent hydrolase